MTDPKADVHRSYREIEEYIESLYSPETDGLSALRKTGEDGHIPIILKDTETLIGVLLAMKKPRRVLEIGTAIGYSASYMAETLKTLGIEDVRVTTMEIDPLYHADAERNLAGRDDVELLLGDARDLLRRMDDRTDEKYGFVFIDAAKSHYAEFWEAVMPHTEPGTVIVCDNVMMKGKTADPSADPEGRFVTNVKYMRQFLEMITADERVRTSVITAGDGMSISVVL